MRRRDFFGFVGAMAAWPLPTSAQPTPKPARVGVLSDAPSSFEALEFPPFAAEWHGGRIVYNLCSALIARRDRPHLSATDLKNALTFSRSGQ